MFSWEGEEEDLHEGHGEHERFWRVYAFRLSFVHFAPFAVKIGRSSPGDE